MARDFLLRKDHGSKVKGTIQTLVVCPKSVIPVWSAAYAELFPGAKVYDVVADNPASRELFTKAALKGTHHIYVTHWESLRFLVGNASKPGIEKVKWFHIIADECHRAKSRKAQQTQALKRIPAFAKTAMSGTAADDKPQDIWSVLNWLHPKRYSSYWRFFNRHIVQKEEYAANGRPFKKMIGVAEVEEFLQEIEPFYVRRLKEEVLPDLPDKYYSKITVPLSPKQRTAYDAMRAQPLDEVVLTPQGWQKMGDLSVGDFVIGSDGKPTEVLGVYPQGLKEVYRIHFGDGTSTRCTDDHLWTCFLPQDSGRMMRTVPLSRIRPMVGKYTAAVRMPTISSPVEFESKGLPVDPYIVGLWLADGARSEIGRVQFGIGDDEAPEMVKQVQACLPSKLVINRHTDINWCIVERDYRRGCSTDNSVRRGMLSLGILNLYDKERYVPEVYKYASPKDRLAVLQGYLDGDGSISIKNRGAVYGNIEAFSTSEQLIDDIVELIRSLGGMARKSGPKVRGRGSKFKEEGSIGWTLRFTPPRGIVPFRLPRKAKLVNPEGSTSKNRSVTSVVKEGIELCQCIKVAATDGLYVTSDYIVTHNTDMLAWVGEQGDTPIAAPVIISQLVRLQQFACAYAKIEERWVTERNKKFDPSLPEEEFISSESIIDNASNAKRNWKTRKFLKAFLLLDEPSSKLDAMMDLLEDNPHEQFVVFSQSKQVINLLAKRLANVGISHGILTGDTKQEDRGSLVEDFQAGELKVFAGTMSAGGVGITLTASSKVVFLDRSWSPSINRQAEDRLHRAGQKNAVQVIDIIAENTIDLGRLQRIELKWAFLRYMLGDKVSPEELAKINWSPKI